MRRTNDDRDRDRKPAARTGVRGATSRRSDDRATPARKAAWKGESRKDERREARPKREIPKGFGPYLSSEPTRERRPDQEFAARGAAPLRTKGVRGKGARKAAGVQKPGRVGRARRLRKGAPPEVRDEIFKIGGRRAQRLFVAVTEAATAFAEGRDKDAARILKPVRDEIPNAASVRELYGLALYRSGRFPQAAKELEAFVELTGSVEQHPVLMDCARAQGDRAEVQVLWDELGSVSPSSALMMEGRIVLAGSMADSGDIRGAVALLEKKESDWTRPQEHHARFWYALGDLYERAGELARARTYFLKVRKYDASYADVAERLSGLR
jgi:Flp pilus assembly protein TadD